MRRIDILWEELDSLMQDKLRGRAFDSTDTQKLAWWSRALKLQEELGFHYAAETSREAIRKIRERMSA